MKIALCTTTINVPTVLKWYRACDADVKFFVVLDKKTPEEAVNFCAYELGDNACVYFDAQQKWKCSEPIGWNSIQRRNIGFLEALKWGADIVISIDDDNLPTNSYYFDNYRALFEKPYNGLHVSAAEGFFDIGDFLFPKSKQRGIPHDNIPALDVGSIVGADIGVAQGLCIGAPDIDAATRFSNKGDVHAISEVARAGLTIDPLSNTVWNSQNTAIRRELIPAWFMWPYAGRHDDIFASVLTHRVMREHGYQVHYGLPMCFQNRNEHDVIKDMSQEVSGYANVKKLAKVLDHTILPGKSVLEDCRLIWRTLSTVDWIDPRTIKAAVAYLDDCETAL